FADACQVAVDVFTMMAPQITGALAGGEALPGGRVGRVALGLRASAVSGFVPDLRTRGLQAGAAQRLPIGSEAAPVPAPVLDAGVGVFPGIELGVGSLGFGRVGSLGLLASIAYLPELEDGSSSLRTPGGSVRFGYGARLGLIEGVPVLPELSLAVIDRRLPTVRLAADAGGGESVRVDDLALRVTSWRVLAAKRFPFVSFLAGAGQDRSRTAADIVATVSEFGVVTESQPVRLRQSLTRGTVFGGVTLRLGPVALSGEIGRQSGADVATYNPVDGEDPSAARTFGSVALRLGI
ncbi:MAG TPA: hypothetical protein VFY16_14505, partial [Gemmatimonadaceae bacterium]|nr:hypothetical protein [Gemmatimonadaceae bacterium]